MFERDPSQMNFPVEHRPRSSYLSSSSIFSATSSFVKAQGLGSWFFDGIALLREVYRNASVEMDKHTDFVKTVIWQRWQLSPLLLSH